MATNRRDTTLNELLMNRSISYKMKGNMYLTDIRSLLLYGIEYWPWNTKIITALNSFQRKSIYRIMNRNWRDRIADVELYKWLKDNKIKIYPMQFVMAERKLKYFGTIWRSSPTDLARQVFWSDVKKVCLKKKEFQYAHITDIKEALKTLHITIEEVNKIINDKKIWLATLQDKTKVAVEKDLKEKWEILIKEQKKKKEDGTYEREILEEKIKNGGWYYKRRSVPSTISEK
jgi:hypothetical protein